MSVLTGKNQVKTPISQHCAGRVILIAARALESTSSGLPRIVRAQVAELSALGYQVHVFGERIDLPAFRLLGAEAVAAVRLPLVRGYLRRRWFAFQAARYARRINADLVIGHGDLLDQDLIFLHNCVHLAHQRIHQSPLPDDSDVGRLHQLCLGQQKFSKLVCNSRMMQEDLCQRFSIDKALTCVIYPAVDRQRFSPQVRSELRQQARVDLHLGDEDLVLGIIVSGAFKKRNVRLFIDLVEYLYKEKKLNNIKAIIAGNNKDREYNRAISSKGLDSLIRTVPVIEAVERYYAALDLFVLPAHIEEFGLSVVEAMACANPVIISARVGAGELLDSSAIVSNMQVEAYAEVILPLLASKALRQKIGRANARIAHSYRSATSLADLIPATEYRPWL